MRRAAICAAATISLAAAACTLGTSGQPLCTQADDSVLVLEAQSVPSATRLPCIAELPIGWGFAGMLVDDTSTTMWLSHDRAGVKAVEVELRATCDVSSGVQVPPGPDEVGMQVYQQPTSLDPYTGSRWLRFEGGCIEYRYRFAPDSEPTLVIEADRALSTLPRSTVVSRVRNDLDLTLCGAGAPPCPG
ncbi:MAG: hypothetical protein ACRDGK_04860 [Actinomycetota bacterium]